MNNAPQQLRELVRSRRKLFVRLFFVALILAAVKFLFPWPNNWLMIAIQIALFILGVLIAPLTFLTESMWKKFLQNKAQMQFSTQESPLRNGLLLLLLPILGIFVLTSSRSPIGLGFLWGVSAWYAGEVWQILQGNTQLLSAYFPHEEQQQDLPLDAILWGFCIYAVVLTFGILFI